MKSLKVKKFNWATGCCHSQSGQMSIFIALIFQVLFVFFAMVINVGLLVHHKINLQNAVDLGAYYAASKQAEMLNAIAHQNYQIRQSWKLLSWRYRILGTVGAQEHPGRGGPDLDQEWRTALGAVPPVVCVTHSPIWGDTPDRETLCLRVYQSGGYVVPSLGIPKVTAGFLPWATAVQDLARRLADKANKRCEALGSLNWQMAAWMLYGYRQDQANRKSVLYKMADNISSSPGDFLDLDGQSVLTGVQKTVEKNLTDPNREGKPRIQLLNSMALGQCKSSRFWLSEIKTSPTLLYADFEKGGGGCALKVKPVISAPTYYANYKPKVDPSGALLGEMQGETQGDMHSSLGVEKNPWCMTYSGVKAQVTPEIPFSPLGDVTLEARAFAKPFGGRIGPWYTPQWARGSDRSTGDINKRLDPRWPPRMRGDGTMDNPQDPTRLPNYARFPGDTLGMKSRAVLSQYGKRIRGLRLLYKMLKWSAIRVETPEGGGDILSFGDGANFSPTEVIQAQKLRELELSAIAPDIFDATYYSIEPKFSVNYFKRVQGNINQMGGGQSVMRGDLGSRSDIDEMKQFNIGDQINTFSGNQLLRKDKLYHQLLDKNHLLTAWSQLSPKNYQLEPTIFGKCRAAPLVDPANKYPPNPGDCVSGGRTGYSVKIISKDYLKSSELRLGGQGVGEGTILNAPPDEF